MPARALAGVCLVGPPSPRRTRPAPSSCAGRQPSITLPVWLISVGEPPEVSAGYAG